ncbi:MAG: DMT family transporter [Pirellulales bacterium]
MAPRKTLLTVGATLLALTSFAGNSLLCRLALRPQSIDAASFTAVRLVTGGIVLLLIALVRWKSLGRFGWGGSWRAALALFAYAAAFSYAYNGLSAGTGALLLFGSVQVSMIAWGMSRGDRPSIAEWIAILTASTGLVVLVFPGLAAPPLMSAALMVLAGAAWGAYSLLGRGSPDPIAATTGNFVRAAAFALPLVAVPLSANWINLPFEANWHADRRGWMLAMASGGLTSAIGYVIWYYALRGLASTRAALVQLAVPVLTAVGGVVLLAETVTPRLFLSAALILGGVSLAFFRRK